MDYEIEQEILMSDAAKGRRPLATYLIMHNFSKVDTMRALEASPRSKEIDDYYLGRMETKKLLGK